MNPGCKKRKEGPLRHRLLGLGVALLAMLALPVGTVAAPKWSVRRLPPKPLEGGSDLVVLNGVSCPSKSLCVAVGALDTVAFSQSPTGGADRWHVIYPTYDVPKQSCLEEEGVPPSSCSFPRGSLDAVSCANERLCVAVAYEGSIYTSTDPAGGAGAWSVNDAVAGQAHLTSVSCPLASLCVAVAGGYGAGAGTILTSTDPVGGTWRSAQLAGRPDLRGVSCATPVLCVAVAKGGQIFVSTDPTAGASAWHEAGSPTPRDLMAVSCFPGLCAAGDAGGNVFTSTDATSGAPFAKTNAAGSVQITGVTCPAINRCVAVDNNSDVLTSTDPTGGSPSWTFENLVPFEADPPDTGQFVGNALFAASCSSATLCVLVGANSRIFTATEPFATPSPSRGSGKKRARLRPRTSLIFAEGFWGSSQTRRHRVKARFRFYSREGADGFICKRDRSRWRHCHSPLRYWAPIGRHTLRVRAIGPTGLRGPLASLHFEVVSRQAGRVVPVRHGLGPDPLERYSSGKK